MSLIFYHDITKQSQAMLYNIFLDFGDDIEPKIH